MKLSLTFQQNIFLWILSLLGMVFLSGCGVGGSDDTAGIRVPNPQTEEEEESQVSIEGVLAIVQSSGSQQNRQFRKISRTQVRLLTVKSEEIGSTTTSDQGVFTFQTQVTQADLPLTLIGTVRNRTYFATIARLSDSISVNINDITTSITEKFMQRSNQSEENFNRIAELVVLNRFGSNREGNSNITPETFLSEDFLNPYSLGNLLLESAEATNISFINEAPEEESLLANRDFLEAFSTRLRGADKPDHALELIQRPPGHGPLFDGLNNLLNAPNQTEVDSNLEQIRMEVLQNSGKKQTKIKELEEQLKNQ